MQVLSIQSSVAFGYVGNSSAGFCLQRLGHEVWMVDTVHFSNHTGYGRWRGPVFDPGDIRAVLAGVRERGVFPQVAAVLSGYQGAEPVGEIILEAVAQVRRDNPQVVYCCDPVMGDVGRGFFVRPGIPEFMRDRVAPAADVLTPNQFELEFLAGRPFGSLTTLDRVLDCVAEIRGRGPGTVLVTSLHTEATAPGTIGMLAVTGEGAWTVQTPKLPIAPSGAGDAVSAIFLVHLLGSGPAAALGATAASIFGIMDATHRAGRRELDLVNAQRELVAPTHHFEVHRVR